jgi:cation-transporting ATPase E
MRRILFTLMVGAFLFGIFFMPNFFQFIPLVPSQFYDSSVVLGAPHILLLLVLAQSTFPMMYVLSNLYNWIKQFIRTIINKIADIQ